MRRILIVDDSSTVRKLMSNILQVEGYEILEANDGAQALEVLAQESVDLAIIDLNMPQMDGIELIETIRQGEGDPDLPIIMLTTQTDEESRRKGLSAGANVFLVKPAPPHVVLYKVKSLLGAVDDSG